jgi:TetR/AcrR family transcriptional regulator, transcriptional repressor for nem operon
MRYPSNQREKTHERIVSIASRMFRDRGYHGTGVNAVMKASGMTAGGFYAHFPSKEELFRESLAAAFHDSRKRLLDKIGGRRRPASELVRMCFEVERAAEAGEGCPIPALGPDVARSGEAVRGTFEEELRKTAEAVTARMRKPGIPADEAALALLAVCSGAILLRRAVKSPELGDLVFEACVHFAAQASTR